MSENIDYQKRQEEVLAWLKAKGKPEPKTWDYHQAADGRYYYYVNDKKKRFGELGACEYCKRGYLKYDGIFCTYYCRDNFRKKRRIEKCSFCKKAIEKIFSKITKSGNYFCSIKCRNKAMRIANDNELYRNIFFQHHGVHSKSYKMIKKITCMICNISDKRLLTVHHIDGNRNNNVKDNLQVLCLTHHAQKHSHFIGHKMVRDYTLNPNLEVSILSSVGMVVDVEQKQTKNESEKIIKKQKKIKEVLYLENKPYILDAENKKRFGILNNCIECNEFYVKLPKHKTNFCSKNCYNKNIHKQKYTLIECNQCKNFFEKLRSKIKSEFNFCNKKCQAEASKLGGILVKAHYTDGKSSYKTVAFRALPNKCIECDISERHLLDVHHKDGNRDNNDIDNLEILCPNHHATRHMRQDDKGEWIYSTKSLTPRDKLDEVKRDLGI